MNVYSTTKTMHRMSRQKFLTNLEQLKTDLEITDRSIRELKSLYFSLNLDYIRQCEENYGRGYLPSRECDKEMSKCNTDGETDRAVEIINHRINQVLSSLK